MQFFSIKRLAITVGMAAALAVGTGIIPNAASGTPTAQAAELGQHGGGHGGGHGSFQGRNYRSSYGFSHTYWGYGFHNYYPQYYVTYAYEPVSICETYYFDEGSWYCFAGY
jgi:hypothetical protein